MKITKLFGAAGLIVFLIGISIVASQNVTLARQDEDHAISTNRQSVENEHEGPVFSGNVSNYGDGESYNVKHRSGDEHQRINRDGSDDESGEREDGHGGNVSIPPPVNPPPSSNATIVSYSQTIQPILNQRCNSCHPKPGVNLSNYAGTKAAVNLLPGMGRSYLSSSELQALLTWIQQGALNN